MPELPKPKPMAGSCPAVEVAESGEHRRWAPLTDFPFRIGRAADCELVLRDARISRLHARILREGEDYYIEDAGSRNGVFVNGERVRRQRLAALDRIEFGIPGGCVLRFYPASRHWENLAERVAAPRPSSDRIGRLRTLLEVARTVETAFSLDEVLASLIDAALEFTGAERGFLFLRGGEGLELKLARHRSGQPLGEGELRVPRAVLEQALDGRRELLSMNFPSGQGGASQASGTIAELELRSVVCLPLVRPAAAADAAKDGPLPAGSTAGLIYLDSRAGEADLSGGNRELLQTLALEASIIVENARLLERERARQRLEEELRIAREIQRSLLPQALPSEGWLRAAGLSEPSHQVGGDYFDVQPAAGPAWALIHADVSGKGVSSALLASLLQGAFAAWPHSPEELARAVQQLNRFLLERTGGEKYATLFYAVVQPDGEARYVNAGHCEPLLVRAGRSIQALPATSLPVGLLAEARYEQAAARLGPGDLLVLYSDGVTDAENSAGERFGEHRLRQIAASCSRRGCKELLGQLRTAVATFAEGAVQKDDLSLLIVEYAGEKTT